MARGVGRDTSKAFCPVPCSQEGKGRVSLILTQHWFFMPDSVLGLGTAMWVMPCSDLNSGCSPRCHCASMRAGTNSGSFPTHSPGLLMVMLVHISYRPFIHKKYRAPMTYSIQLGWRGGQMKTKHQNPHFDGVLPDWEPSEDAQGWAHHGTRAPQPPSEMAADAQVWPPGPRWVMEALTRLHSGKELRESIHCSNLILLKRKHTKIMYKKN